MENKTKTIAIIGHRGIPAGYGGFETFAEKITPCLIKQGYQVINYCRKYPETQILPSYLGSQLVYLPTFKKKSIDTLVHTFLSVIHVLFHPVDSIIMVNVGNAPFTWIPRIRGIKVVLNVDGFEWTREKWGKLAKAYFKFSSWLAPKVASKIVTDIKVVQDYYWNKFKAKSVMIPYGTEVERITDQQGLEKYGLQSSNYFLFVARFEPEYNPLLIRRAYENVKTNMPLVMVGDSPYASDYVKQVKSTTNPKIKFLGYVYGNDYRLLQQNAFAYIKAGASGGTSPALVEAMGYGNCVLVNDCNLNREVVAEAGIYYQLNEDSLSMAMQKLSNQPEQAEKYRQLAQARAKANYSWTTIANDYIKILN